MWCIDKMIRRYILNISLVSIVLLFVVTMLVKRFVYFRPDHKFRLVGETYKVIQHAHLHGWLAEGSSGAKIILICRGNKGNISYDTSTISSLNQLGYSVLIFDYSGFGKSNGIPSEQQLYEDASYMVALLRQTYQPEQIVLYGEGIGASVATYAARRYSIPTLILVSPFPNAHTVVNDSLLKFIPILFSEFQTIEYLVGYQGRSLMIHSVQDEIVPYHSTTELQNAVTLHIPTTGLHSHIEMPWQDMKRFIDTSPLLDT